MGIIREFSICGGGGRVDNKKVGMLIARKRHFHSAACGGVF